MAIAFYAEDTKLPAIKKRAVGNWVKEVAATYGKKVGDISYNLLLRREDSGSKPPVPPT